MTEQAPPAEPAALDTERHPAPTRVFGRLFPAWARAFVRAREAGLVVVALFIGVVSGLAVTAMSLASQAMHEFLFDLPRGLRLSLASALDPWRVLGSVMAGGVLLALLAHFLAPRFRGRLHDAIEANALLGGRMSIGGSAFITLQTMVSNGFGGSVGLEAAYTQVCSAFASRLGRELGARRNDMRLLVACGAAGATRMTPLSISSRCSDGARLRRGERCDRCLPYVAEITRMSRIVGRGMWNEDRGLRERRVAQGGAQLPPSGFDLTQGVQMSCALLARDCLSRARLW